MSFGFGDVVAVLHVAKKIYDLGGFKENQRAPSQYREFGEDVHRFLNNLLVLRGVLERAQNESEGLIGFDEFGGLKNLNEILGDYRKTLSDCETLLLNRKHFEYRNGIIDSMRWNATVAKEISDLRYRIHIHNLKLSTALNTLEIHAIKDLRYQMQDGVSQILTQLDKIRRDIGVEVDEDDQTRNSCATPFTVPLEVKDAFTELAEQICYDLSRMPVAAGLESVVYHLDRATKPTATKTQPEDWYCASVLSLMKATWLLELTTASEGYSDACSYEATDQLENKMMEWGMTIKKYTEKLEQNLATVCDGFRPDSPEFPKPEDILALLKTDSAILADGLLTSDGTTYKTILGEEIMKFELHVTDPRLSRTVHLFQNAEKYFTLVGTDISTSGPKKRDKWEKEFSLDRVHLIPAYQWKRHTPHPFEIKIKSEEMDPRPRTLIFTDPNKMFRLQRQITGYRVALELPSVTMKSQHANFLSGHSREYDGSLQIWYEPSEESTFEAQAAISSINSETSLQSRRCDTHGNSRDSSVTCFTPVLRETKTEQFGPSPTRKEFRDCGELPTANPDGGAIYAKKTSRQISSHVTDTIGRVYTAPRPPCLVFSGQKKDKNNRMRCIIVIELGGKYFLNKGSCSCDDETKSCKRAVIEKKRADVVMKKSKDVVDHDDLNLAQAGWFQRNSTLKKVKRAKNLVLTFQTDHERSEFNKKFEAILKVYGDRNNHYQSIAGL